jgi:hypothetical protein
MAFGRSIHIVLIVGVSTELLAKRKMQAEPIPPAFFYVHAPRSSTTYCVWSAISHQRNVATMPTMPVTPTITKLIAPRSSPCE